MKLQNNISLLAILIVTFAGCSHPISNDEEIIPAAANQMSTSLVAEIQRENIIYHLDLNKAKAFITNNIHHITEITSLELVHEPNDFLVINCSSNSGGYFHLYFKVVIDESGKVFSYPQGDEPLLLYACHNTACYACKMTLRSGGWGGDDYNCNCFVPFNAPCDYYEFDGYAQLEKFFGI